MIDKIFLDLSIRFQGPYPLTNADISERPLRALILITRLSTTVVALKSYELFKTIMQSTVAPERKMEAARLALHAAYQPGLESLPPVGDPKQILDFLHYHIGSHVKMEDRTHAISSVMRAIDSAFGTRTTTWCIENADELMAWFEKSPEPKEFEWWYGVLWLHYGGLDSGIRERMDEVAMSEDDRIDLKQCKVVVEKEIERVKELDRASDIVRSLDDAYTRLTALIDHRDRVRDGFSGFRIGLRHFFSSPVYRFCLRTLFISYGITGGHRYSLPSSAGDRIHIMFRPFPSLPGTQNNPLHIKYYDSVIFRASGYMTHHFKADDIDHVRPVASVSSGKRL